MAAIIDERNYPICPGCESILIGGITDYGIALTKSKETYLYIERRCPICGHAHEYLMSMDLDHRYNITDVEIIKINKK